MYEYKDEIRQTRLGCLGGSDGKTLLQISQLGYVPKSAYKRMAVAKGIIEQEDIPTNSAMQMGNEVENIIYQYLLESDVNYQSNPRLESKRYSRRNVKLIAHPDFMLVDEENKVVKLYECKATIYNFNQTRDTYKAQLYIEQCLGREYAMELGSDYRLELYLVHYCTDGIDYSNGFEFDPSRLTVKKIRIESNYFNIAKSMDIVNDFLKTFDEYYGNGDEIDYNLLPKQVQAQFTQVANIINEIKEKEEFVNDFKKRLYAFMCEKGIKSIKNDSFTIVRVDESESKSFDAKRYVEDEMKSHPRKMKKIVEQYTKTTKRKGFAMIKTKDQQTTN